ncbi:MAG: HNH endonuclease [Actinomycetia bacterium]|nr:HNH endonuclease [Actinomycetes bacterium]
MFAPDSLPEPLTAVLAQVRDWTSADAHTTLAGDTAQVRAGWVTGLQQLADAVAAATLTAVAAFDAAGDGQTLHGAASTPAWLRGACRITGAEASERVRIARRARDLLADPVDHVRDGMLTYEHLRAVERGVRHLPPDQQQRAVDLLTDLAQVAPVGDVRTAGKHLQHVIDPDGALADTCQQFDRRHLTLAPLMDGMTAMDGLLDAESAALLTAALAPFLVPADQDDTRTAAQRRADGLVQIVQTATDHALLPIVGGERPHLHVLVDPRAPHRSAGQPCVCGAELADTAPEPDVLPPGRLTHSPGAPAFLHPLAVARLACDAQLTALLLNDQGVVVDLGRTRRLFSPQQRKLLAARDGGCRWVGCDRPPAHTDAHHVASWLDGGTTDLANALLLCRHHHRAVHENGWTLQITNPSRGTHGPVTVHGPNGQHHTSHPRGP